MKSDMGGAAAVLAAVVAIARLGLEVNVTACAPMAENMPSGTAQRPSDVLTMYGGKTVEVLNTDAEGRLILADALVRAGEDEPDVIVDVATLTGAQLVALGKPDLGDHGQRRRSATASAPRRRRRRADLADAAARRAARGWTRRSPTSPTWATSTAGMLVAGLFLKEFVKDGLRWAHLDIAGPSCNAGAPTATRPRAAPARGAHAGRSCRGPGRGTADGPSGARRSARPAGAACQLGGASGRRSCGRSSPASAAGSRRPLRRRTGCPGGWPARGGVASATRRRVHSPCWRPTPPSVVDTVVRLDERLDAGVTAREARQVRDVGAVRPAHLPGTFRATEQPTGHPPRPRVEPRRHLWPRQR